MMSFAHIGGRSLFAAALVVLAACPEAEGPADAGPRQTEWPVHGRPGEGPLPVPDEVPVEQFCAYVEESFCDFQVRCDPTANYQRIEACRTDETLPTYNCLTTWQYPMQERQAMGTLRYRGDAVSACLRALDIERCIRWDKIPECDFSRFTEGQGILGACCFDSSECSSGFCGDRGPNPEPDTRGRCRAKLGEGSGRCFRDSECEEGLRCAGGLCKTPLPVDSSCVPNAVPCVEGAFCVGPAGSEVCQTPAPMGMRCDRIGREHPPCARGLACEQADGDRFGVCRADRAEGELCDETLACSPGLRCTVANPTDRARCVALTYGTEGEFCEAGQGTDRCDSRHHCSVEVGTRSGVCVPYSDLGENCDGRLPCRRGWCRPLDCDDLSRPCSAGRPGVCSPFQDLGEACGNDTHCGPEDGGRFCSEQGLCSGLTAARCD